MFHDCGYFRHPELRKAAASTLELSAGEADLTAAAMVALNREEYREAIRAVGSLLAHLRGRRGHWDFGATGGAADQKMQSFLARQYRTLESHSIVSGLDLAAEMIRAIHSASRRGRDNTIDRAFLAGHVFPAAAAIAMHDWKLWPHLRECNLFPFRASHYPLAGLLIYLDTWDDYRRRDASTMTLAAMDLGTRSASARVRWGDPNGLAMAKVGYQNYAQSVKWPKEMCLNIVVDEGQQ